jgi:hypothetical protein
VPFECAVTTPDVPPIVALKTKPFSFTEVGREQDVYSTNHSGLVPMPNREIPPTAPQIRVGAELAERKAEPPAKLAAEMAAGESTRPAGNGARMPTSWVQFVPLAVSTGVAIPTDTDSMSKSLERFFNPNVQ